MTIKQMAVRLPRLLDKDLNEVRRLQARSQSVELNITPLSTASVMLEDGSGVAIRSFVELYNAKGSVGVFRVSLPEESFGSGERIRLEHGICALDDATVHGKGEISGTPTSVLSQILTNQTTQARGKNLWAVGTVEAPDSINITVEHDGTKTLEMLMRYIGELQEYRLDFDQSGFPWKVNVIKKPDAAACEGRLSRNIRAIRKTMDDSDLCTRLYCSLLDGGYIESDTINAWGAVEQEITLNDGMTAEDVSAYCRRYLNNRKNPVLAVEMDASEWFVMTGERLDRFEIGDICRLALPEYGVVIEERIVALHYMDALGRPEAVSVSLANQMADLSIRTAQMQDQINNLNYTSAKYGNRIGSSEKEITNLKEENEGFKEVDNKIVKWFSKAEIDLDATEEGAKVGILATYEETYDLFSEVDKRVSEAELVLYGGPEGATAGLVARVNDNAAMIVATANDLQTEINLKADKITLQGYVTASELAAEIAEINRSYANYIETAALSTQSLDANYIETNTFSIGGTQLKLLTKSLLNGNTTLTVNSTGGTVTGVTLNRKYTEFHYLGYE